MNISPKTIKYLGNWFPFLKAIRSSAISVKKTSMRLSRPVDWGSLRTHTPVSTSYGLDRGETVDRYYMEEFLRRNRKYIKGNVLEILDDRYTIKFGGKKVRESAILDIDRKNKFATVYDDLRSIKNIKDNTFDCLILTQVFQFIDDNPAALGGCFKILKKGGTLLATLPAFSRTDVASGVDGDYWRYTVAGAKYLFGKVFGVKNVWVKSFGNVLAGTAFWQGMAWEDLSTSELSYNDLHFPLIIAVRASKPR